MTHINRFYCEFYHVKVDEIEFFPCTSRIEYVEKTCTTDFKLKTGKAHIILKESINYLINYNKVSSHAWTFINNCFIFRGNLVAEIKCYM